MSLLRSRVFKPTNHLSASVTRKPTNQSVRCERLVGLHMNEERYQIGWFRLHDVHFVYIAFVT